MIHLSMGCKVTSAYTSPGRLSGGIVGHLKWWLFCLDTKMAYRFSFNFLFLIRFSFFQSMAPKKEEFDKEYYDSRYDKIRNIHNVISLFSWMELDDIKRMIKRYYAVKENKEDEKVKLKTTANKYFLELAQDINDFSIKKGNNRKVQATYLSKIYFLKPDTTSTRDTTTGVKLNSHIINQINEFLTEFIAKNERKAAGKFNKLLDDETEARLSSIEKDIYLGRLLEAKQEIENLIPLNDYSKARINVLRSIIEYLETKYATTVIEHLVHAIDLYRKDKMNDNADDAILLLSTFKIINGDYQQNVSFYGEQIDFFRRKGKIKHLYFEYILYAWFLFYHGNFWNCLKILTSLKKVIRQFEDTVHFDFFLLTIGQIFIIEAAYSLYFNYSLTVLNSIAKEFLKNINLTIPIRTALNSYRLARHEYNVGNFDYDKYEQNDLSFALTLFEENGMQYHLLKAYILRSQFIFVNISREKALEYLADVHKNKIEKEVVEMLIYESNNSDNADLILDIFPDPKHFSKNKDVNTSEDIKRNGIESLLRSLQYLKYDFFCLLGKLVFEITDDLV